MKVCFNTFGCKTNQYDTALIEQTLAGQGIEVVTEPSDADWVVVSTCAVTRRAEDKACQWVRRIGRECPQAAIAVLGCSVEVSAARFRDLPNMRLLLGTEEKFRLGEVLAGLAGQGVAQDSPLEYSGSVSESRAYSQAAGATISDTQARTRAFLKIQDGCNNRCTYCIVPRTRGPERSRPLEEVLAEARALEASGHRELVLTGIHIGRYGAEPGEKSGLTRLVETLLAGTSRVRIRLSSVELGELDSALIDLLASEPRLCRHLHLPLQHGCDSVLERMGRWYNTAEFRAQVESLCAKVPRLGLGSDLIAGFPGESETEFRAGYAFVKELPFTYFHAFPFSPRPSTVAADLEGQVGPALARERVRALRQLSGEKNVAFRNSMLGSNLPVLAETTLAEGTLACRADNYVRVYCAPPVPEEQFELRITRLWRDGLWGETGTANN
ncbi:tRNA (N(6)-L-threonylcarbamoyladenosine(37)-C(2))-methylthiotransferase MtaB [bacterium]|nr:tRNA (N(6)-L-threonylcarbamoyladenosine(37)-C(2))-methylthiotransferase MtaB [bacterium]